MKPRVVITHDESGLKIRINMPDGTSYGVMATAGCSEGVVGKEVERILNDPKRRASLCLGGYLTHVQSYWPHGGYNVYGEAND